MQESETPERPRVSRRERAAVLAILVVALALRAWFGWADPTPRRFFDEQFALENVGHLLRSGDPKPANGYHPTLSYLPQAIALGGLHGLAALTGRGELRPLGPGPCIGNGVERPATYPFTPLAYHVGRLVQALLGTLAVALTLALGRFLGGPALGLAAATLATVSPQLVRQSSLINEDISLVVTVVLAVLAAARAGAHPTWKRYLYAGAAVGLACSSKFNGAAAALPLIAVTCLRAVERRAWVRLVAAGAVAVAVFLLLDPFVLVDRAMYVRDFGRTVGHYAKKGVQQGETHGAVLLSAAGAALDPAFLGAAGGGAALLGAALLLPVVVRTRQPQRRFAAAAVLAFLLGYPALYALATRGVMRHNWLPLLPLLAVAAGHLLVAVKTALDRWTGRRWLGAATAAFLLAATAVPELGATYVWGTPPTAAAVGALLATRLGAREGRIVAVTGTPGEPLVMGLHSGTVIRLPPEPADLERWRRLDAVVVAEGDGATAALASGLRDRRVPSVLVAARAWRRRGPALRVFLPGWQPTARGDATPLQCAGRGHLVGSLAPPPGSHLSLALSVPSGASPVELLVGGRPAPLHLAAERRSRQLFYSERVPRPPGERVQVEVEGPCNRPLRAALLGWSLTGRVPPAASGG